MGRRAAMVTAGRGGTEVAAVRQLTYEVMAQCAAHSSSAWVSKQAMSMSPTASTVAFIAWLHHGVHCHVQVQLE